MPKTQQEKRERRKHSIRKKVNGTAERPRLTVFRSSKHIYAQVVNDDAHQTIATASTLDEQIIPQLAGLKKSEKAKKIGAAIAERLKAKGIDKVVFDRNGYIYHGRIMALADAAREAGLKF
ncbi:MAG TPA: 50S ribosomal protein L18 [Polyangia bacterium]|jgi:large subunit ribosomal protein L18